MGDVQDGVRFADAFRFWLKLGFINFGGPTGQIAIMHDEIVDRKRWIDEDRFLHALSYCLLLPGPEAQQLAIYVGWLLNGTAGGIAAGVLFVLPATVLILVLAWSYAVHGEVTAVAGILDGLAAAVVGIVAAATISIGKRALRTGAMIAVAAAVFVAIYLLGALFPLVILGAGLIGVVLYFWRPGLFPESQESGSNTVVHDAATRSIEQASLGRALRVAAIGLAAWWGPLFLVAWLTGGAPVIAQEGVFFSQVAVITFGGAYAVLAYIAQEAVQRFALTARDVVAGLGLAETTPGPLIMVLPFLGFQAAYREPGDLSPLLAGSLGMLVTVWATFAPSFLWIFLGAPYVERLRSNRQLRAALQAITAAVVGVIASLALTFATRVLFDEVHVQRPFGAPVLTPVWSTIQPFHLVVAVAAFVAMWRLRWHVVWVVLAAAAAGLIYALVR